MARRRQRSYPPSVWGGGAAPVVPATGATAGIPGTWTPPGSTPPASVTALAAGTPNVVTASPATAWTTGQYVQTATAGAAGRATWSGTTWVGAVAAEFDPADHTVAEVCAYLADHPDDAGRVMDAEAAGKNRAGIMSWEPT